MTDPSRRAERDGAPPARRSTVQRQLALLVAGLVVLASLGLTLVGFFYTRGILKDATRSRLEWQAAVRAEDVASWLERQRGNVVLVASRTRLRNLLAGRASDAQGRRLEQVAAPILWDARDATPSFKEIWIAGGDGRIVAATDLKRIGESVADAPSYRKGRERTFVGEPVMTPEGPEVIVAGPITERSGGDLLGTVMIRIDATPVVHLIGSQGAGPTAGRIVVASQGAEGWRQLFVQEELALPSPALLARAASGRKGFQVAKGADGEDYLVAYVPVPGTTWALAAETSAENAYAPVTRLRYLTFAVAAIVLLLGLAGAAYVARRVTRPLAGLVAASREIAAGKLTARAAETGELEFAELAHAFNDMAEALHEQTANLDDLVRKRTAALAASTQDLQRSEWELRGALHDARRAERARSAFLAAVSHDIRSPVSAVLGMAEVLRLDPASESQRRDLDAMHDAAVSLLMLLDDILDFSRLEAGAVSIDAKPYSLREALGEAVQQHALAAYRKGLELTLYVDPSVPDALIGDAGRLRQIVGNLVSNAVKFTKEGEIAVSVPPPTAGGRQDARIKVVVTDTGPGVAPEYYEQIFNAFEQGASDTWGRHGGSGLGLAICRHLAGLMGGNVGVGARSGQGARFTLQLPLIEDRDAAPATKPLDGVTVLLFLPHEATRAAARACLERDGASVLEAEDTAAARAPWVADEHAADVLLVDREAWLADDAGALRDTVEKHGVPHVLLVPPTSGDAAGHGGDHVALVKPLLAGALRTALDHALGRAEQAPSVSTLDAVDEAHRRQVLVVDDSPVLREVATRLLKRRGHMVRSARGGDEAIALFERLPADVVLMDLNMPGRDGWSTTKALRETAEGAACRIVAMSAHVLGREQTGPLEAGFDAFLAKPAPLAELIAAVESGGPVASAPGAKPAEPDVNASVFDLDRALSRVGGSHEMLERLKPTLREEAEELFAALRAAVARGDAPNAALAAHTLKGSLDVFGATRAVRAAWALESHLRAGVLEGAAGRIDDLERAVGEVFQKMGMARESGTAESGT